MESYRELIIKWSMDNFTIPRDELFQSFIDVVNRRSEDVFNFIFVNNVNAVSLLQTAIMAKTIDETLDKAMPVIEEAKQKYGEVWYQAKNIFTTHFVEKYHEPEGRRQ